MRLDGQLPTLKPETITFGCLEHPTIDLIRRFPSLKSPKGRPMHIISFDAVLAAILPVRRFYHWRPFPRDQILVSRRHILLLRRPLALFESSCFHYRTLVVWL